MPFIPKIELQEAVTTLYWWKVSWFGNNRNYEEEIILKLNHLKGTVELLSKLFASYFLRVNVILRQNSENLFLCQFVFYSGFHNFIYLSILKRAASLYTAQTSIHFAHYLYVSIPWEQTSVQETVRSRFCGKQSCAGGHVSSFQRIKSVSA